MMAFSFQQAALEALVAVAATAIMIWLVVAAWRASAKKEKALTDAREAYHASLERLRSDPANPNLRQETLDLGRAYANLTRENKGVTIFDEVALSNDIGAACAAAGAPTPVTPPPTIPPAAASIQDRLRQLESLRDQSLITEDEYAIRREAILNEV